MNINAYSPQFSEPRYKLRKLGRRLLWALFVSAVVGFGLLVAAQATDQDLTSLLPHSTKPVQEVPAKGYGFSTSLVGLSAPELDKQLSAMQAAGASWVRYDLSWDAVQHNSPTSYDWSNYDALTTAAAGHGMKVVMVLDFAPPWARPASCTTNHPEMCGPSDPAAYGRFAAAAVQHYRPYGVEDWEIWNEPNISYRFRPAANPDLYVAMLKAAYTSIKQADPHAEVIAASTAPSASNAANYTPTDFLSAMYDAGAGGYFDAISAHPYTYPNTPAQANPADAWGQLTTMHDVMAAHGDAAKQIWITEFGAPTNGPNEAGDHVSEAVQAQILTEAAQIFHGFSWSGPFMWYGYQDAGNHTWTSEDFYGLVRYDGGFKPSFYAYKDAAAKYGK